MLGGNFIAFSTRLLLFAILLFTLTPVAVSAGASFFPKVKTFNSGSATSVVIDDGDKSATKPHVYYKARLNDNSPVQVDPVSDSLRKHGRKTSLNDAIPEGRKDNVEFLPSTKSKMAPSAVKISEQRARAKLEWQRAKENTRSVMPDEHVVFDTAGSNPDMIRMMQEVWKSVATMREAVAGLTLQNQLIYKQLKRLTTETCVAAQTVDDGPKSVVVKGTKMRLIESGDHLEPRQPPSCPSGYSHSTQTGSCYRLVTNRVTWRMAQERCRVQRAELLNIGTSGEQRVLAELARSSPDTQHCDFWIGLTRSSAPHSEWQWNDDSGAPSFTNWNYNEPNNASGREHCAQMLWVFHWKWNDAQCNYGNACYICETRPQ